MFKPLVYICSPFKGDIRRNIKYAVVYAEFAYKNGAIPITPHIQFPFLDDNDDQQRKDAMFMGIILLGKCQEVWVFGNKITEGMKEELNVAKRRRQKIRFFDEECVEIVKDSLWK